MFKMGKIVHVGTGQVKVGRKGEILKSAVTGSCVVIAACDSEKNLSLMVHVLIPGRALKNTYGESIDVLGEVCDCLGDIICDKRTLTFDLSSLILYKPVVEMAGTECLN